MTTSVSSEAMWNFKKYVWTSENWHNKEIKYQGINIYLKIKENKKSRNLSTTSNKILLHLCLL